MYTLHKKKGFIYWIYDVNVAYFESRSLFTIHNNTNFIINLKCLCKYKDEEKCLLYIKRSYTLIGYIGK